MRKINKYRSEIKWYDFLTGQKWYKPIAMGKRKQYLNRLQEDNSLCPSTE